MHGSNLQEALVKNWLNSPFVSPNDDGTEFAIRENHLYFMRQIRQPVSISSFYSGAELFRKIISREVEAGDDVGLKLVFSYEQYFARIELLSCMIRFETQIRQCVHAHLKKKVPISDLKDKMLLNERESIIKGVLRLLRTLVRRDVEILPDLRFPLRQFELLVDKLYTLYLAPLVLLRNAMCHGNIRSYISGLGRDDVPTAGVLDSRNEDGRAVAIYNNIDAVTYYILSQNLAIVHRLTYGPLSHYKSGELAKRILVDANESGTTGFALPDDLLRSIPKKCIEDITNRELKEACVAPSQLYEDFVKACHR